MVGMSDETPAPRRASARDDVLAAAARLFGTQGFAATSTREIAQAVGIRQPSLYYHFPTKDAILSALLDATVTPSIEVAGRLEAKGLDPAPHLAALLLADALLLARSPFNAGALYALPETAREEFAEFRRNRDVLRDAYSALAARIPGGDATLGPLAFAMVEAVPHLRVENPGQDPERLAARVAAAALRVAGLAPEEARAALERGRAALDA